MSEIVVNSLTKTFWTDRKGSRVRAADDVSLHVRDGEMLVLLGPSGCGKTTTLRCVAGLEQPDSGQISFADRPIFDRSRGINVRAHRRDLGMVFQTFALWPHLTAGQNIEFPLRQRRVPKRERKSLVAEIAALVDLDATLLEKVPGKLSGGQQQRVALSRALVGKPSVVLFDEPLSNLDTVLREQLRSELHRLHRRIGFTGVYVTHDLSEALALGDRVAAMRAGRIDQIGTAERVFSQPAVANIARVVGYRPILDVEPLHGRWTGVDAQIEGDLPSLEGCQSRVAVFCRPEDIAVRRPGDVHQGQVRIVGGVLRECAYLGGQVEFVISFGSREVRALVQGESADAWAIGEEVAVEASPDALRYYEEDGCLWEHETSAVPAAGRNAMDSSVITQ